MASSIDVTKPTAGNALTADVRQNFAYAKSEIETLQDTAAPAAASNFTPTAAGLTTAGACTYTNQVGRAYKIGRLVHFQILISWTGHTGTGQLAIEGLPYTVDASAPSPIMSARPGTSPPGAGKDAFCVGAQGASRLIFQTMDATTGAVANFNVPAASGNFLITGQYLTPAA